MTTAGVKFDDGSGGFISNCFPARSFMRTNDDDGGAWLLAQRAEQRRRFKAVLCSKPKTFDDIRNERKRAEKERTLVPASKTEPKDDSDANKTLDGFFLMKHCCVDDPSDLCSVNISGQNLSEMKEEDFMLFDNVAYLNAGENILSFEPLSKFPILRELEMPLNGLRGLTVSTNDFLSLELLDLSFNNLGPKDLLALGLLRNLRILHLTGNGLTTLPTELSHTYQDDNGSPVVRYPCLEILLLDDNKLSDLTTFATLAGLPCLKHLSLAKNQIVAIPQLLLVEGRHVTQTTETASSPKSGRGSKQRSRKSQRRAKEETINSPSQEVDSDRQKEATEVKDEDKTEEGMDSSRTDPTESDVKMTTEMTVAPPGFVPPVAPFPELRHLNLSHNKICEEEGVLAVAAWPMLSELVLHHNPLTIHTSGDPPLLTRYLRKRLGIQIQRKEPQPLEKPHIEMEAKPERQVDSIIPRVPRCDVDKLLAIEASYQPHPPIERQESSQPQSPLDRQDSFSTSKPLPPISNDNQPQTEDSYEGEAFFMTQNPDEQTTKSAPAESPVSRPDTKERPVSQRTQMTDDYAILAISDEEEEPDTVPPPSDITGNVRALQYALKHPLVFRENQVHLDKPQKTFKPHQRRRGHQGGEQRSTGVKTKEALETLRDRVTVIEAPLDVVLEDKDTRQKFPGARQLLGEVQGRYNAVRETSMKNARQRHEAANILKETLQIVDQTL